MPDIVRLQFKRTLGFFNNCNRHTVKFNSLVLRACCISAAIVTQRYIAVNRAGID